MINIAIFASGGGSNAREICKYFKNHSEICVSLIVSNKEEAGVHKVAADNDIPSIFINKKQYQDIDFLNEILDIYQIDYIILAGFLQLIPEALLQKYERKILNIHPSLLPKYGGKGMYGHHVHEAVKNNSENETGMTIHIVNEKYDEGQILFQGKCPIDPNMNVDEIAAAVLQLEHRYYGPTIENYILNDMSIS